MPTIDDVDREADQFERLLNRHGISIATGSRLEASLLFARHVLHVRAGTGDIGTHDDLPQWREMHGIFDLARRLVWAERTTPRKFEALLPWLKLFSSTRGQLAQNAPTEQGDQDSDKIFELLVALCLLPRIGQISPDRGQGDNPDLLFRFGWKTWGIACKRLYSTASARFRDTVRKAIAQIEASSAERGLVFVSLVNVVNHDRFYSKTEDGGSRGMSFEAMMHVLDAEQRRLTAETVGLTDHDLANEFIGMKAMPGVVHYVGTTYMTGSPDDPRQHIVQHAWSRGRVNGQLHHWFQDGLNSTSSEYRLKVRRR